MNEVLYICMQVCVHNEVANYKVYVSKEYWQPLCMWHGLEHQLEWIEVYEYHVNNILTTDWQEMFHLAGLVYVTRWRSSQFIVG